MNKRLGIIDWGIGGVSVYRLVREQLGEVPVTYFSDTGVTPYGKMSRSELVARLNSVIRSLQSQGVTHIAIGCNAASTAIPFLGGHDIPIEGVILPAVEMTARLKPAKLGLIGGRRTVVSGVYRTAFADKNIAVRQRIAQPLSAAIESGDISSDNLRAAAKRIITPLRNCSHILLACTHYPAITPMLQTLVSAGTQFIDPAAELVRKIARWKIVAGGDTEFLTSGNAKQMITAAEKAFGVKIPTATVVYY